MPKNVLIIEDEFVIAHDLRNILQKLDYNVVGLALNEAKAKQLLEEETVDIVLLDIQLKGEKAGFEIAQWLNDRYCIPFVYVTSFSDSETIAQITKTNPDGYVRKPFNGQDIYAALEIALARADNRRLLDQNVYLTEEIKQSHDFENILGESEPMQKVFKLIDRVASVDTTVLIQGETDTGKELVARALHNHSPRRANTMIKINCAALPTELIESELFGHEKGAFTGALQARLGKLELAHQSTVFLDEIGELPLALQAKLLRFLQEKEVEPLGGHRTRKVDVRVVAATNRDLQEEVAAGRFRSDLYFRLNVFPITVPPLRERGSDIETLSHYFLRKASQKTGRPAPSLVPEVVHQLTHYHWPGNVRELEHTIERAMLLSEGADLMIPTINSRQPPAPSQSFSPIPLQKIERDHIHQTLNYCDGRIRGEGGAAELLDIKPTTLEARIKKLGIKKAFTKE